MFRRTNNNTLEVFLIHLGGPYWQKKDLGVWSIPKGEYEDNESPLAAAQREFKEETGFPSNGPFLELGEITQPSGKIVTAWAFAGDADPSQLRSNTFFMEWPPRSGQQREFPEVDRGAWYPIDEARRHLMTAQHPFLDRLIRHVSVA